MDGWMDGCPWDTALLVFRFSVKYTACARSFVRPRGAPQWPRLSARECARRRRVVFFRGFFLFFFFFVFLFITKTLKGLGRESHRWDAGSERRVVERPPLFFFLPPALHSSGTFCSPPTPPFCFGSLPGLPWRWRSRRPTGSSGRCPSTAERCGCPGRRSCTPVWSS